MGTRFKWLIEDSVHKGNRYDKIYHGSYHSDNDTSVCDYGKNPKTFVNYGVIVDYCPEEHEVLFKIEGNGNSKRYRELYGARANKHLGHSYSHKKVRITRGEIKIIKENNNIIDVKILDRILNRDC